MTADRDGPREFASSRLDERILSTLHGLPGRLAFSGLRRVLRAHPESLARALRRLEREGLVERVDGGYRALSGGSSAPPAVHRELRSIAAIDLPDATPSDVLLARLSGRWFGSLRWVGVVERSEDRLLAWARRDGSEYVLLGIDRGRLKVYVPADTADASSEGDDAAYELLVHAVEALRPSVSPAKGAVTFLLAARTPMDGWPGDN